MHKFWVYLGGTILAIPILFGLGVWAGAVPYASPSAGQEAVLIQRPILFGHGGVSPEPVKTGRTMIAWTTQVLYVDVRPVQYELHFDDFMSRDGVPLDFDAIIRIQVIDSVSLIRDFGVDFYNINIRSEFANLVRQAVRKYGMNEVAIDATAIDAIDREVSAALATYFTSAGLPVRLVQVTVGRANPPDAIKDQRVATAQQQQRQITERERKLAEDIRLAAETSRAAADDAYRQSLGLTPEQFVELERIGMQRAVCGVAGRPCTFIVGQSPVMSLPVVPNR